MALMHEARVMALRKVFRVDVAATRTPTEITLQGQLNEAHQCYFRRQYVKALEKYKAIWWWIHTNVRPELPHLDHGASFGYAIKPRVDDFRKITDRLGPLLAHLDANLRIPLDLTWPPGPTPDPSPIERLGLSSKVIEATDLATRRDALRTRLADPPTMAEAVRGYVALAQQAFQRDDRRFAAETFAELGAALGAASPHRQPPAGLPAVLRELESTLERRGAEPLKEEVQVASQMLTASMAASRAAAKLFDELGDDVGRGLALHNLAEAMDAARPGSGLAVRQQAAALLPDGLQVDVGAGTPVALKSLVQPPAAHRSTRAVRAVARVGGRLELATLREERADRDELGRTYTVYRGNYRVERLPVSAQFSTAMVNKLYAGRVAATTLDQLDFHAEVVTNVVAYIPHLYFYVLPIAVGDCHVALGNYVTALGEYTKAEIYPYLNHGIEAEYLWLKKAAVYVKWGDFHFRQRETAKAAQRYHYLLTDTFQVPVGGALYAGSVYARVRGDALLIAAALRDGTPMPKANPEVIGLLGKAYQQLNRLKHGLNFLGLADDWYPILRFRYLQSVARYFAEHAIQAERTYLNFLDAAERAEFQRLQLENTLDAETKAIEIEQMRVQDALHEQNIANLTHQHTQLRLQHANDAITQWDTDGRELTRMNAVLSWASHAANDQDIRVGGVRYHGQTHEFDTDVEQFYDIVGEWKEWLSWEMQRERLVAQRDQVQSELAISQARAQQAAARVGMAQLGVQLATIRRDGTRELLDYVEDRILDEDTWFRLANSMRDVATDYLYMAIEAAFVMQRAYALEMDRDLDIIRFDYQHNGLNGLLAGDFLLRDIDRFTIDFLNNARKRNPIRQMISLASQYPQAFAQFRATGVLPFRTTLEDFDRRYPGTHGRKLRKVEIFVEGLVPPEGAHGHLEQLGVSWEWKRAANGTWQRASRGLGPERLFVSSYQMRRDLAVFQPSDELLEMFEQSGVEAHWTFVLPRASNDLEYEAIIAKALDESDSEVAWGFSFVIKLFNSPVLTILGLFVVAGFAIAGHDVDLRRGTLFVNVGGTGRNGVTLGAISYVQGGHWTGGSINDDVAQHEAYHSRQALAFGEIGFYLTYLVVGTIWGAIEAGEAFATDASGCGNPFEKTARTFNHPAPATPTGSC
jgi:hypothetical protein